MKSNLLIFLVGALAAPVGAHAESLWQAWQAARMHDPQFQAARAALRAGRTARPSALAALLPQLTGSANRTIDNQSSAGPEFYGSQIVPVESSANTRSTGWQLALTQPLFDWSAIKQLQAADLDVAAAAARYQSTFAGLAARLVGSYLDVLSARANLRATEQAAAAFAEQYREADERYKAGLSGIIGANASQAALATAQADVLTARRRLTGAENALAALTGAPAAGRFPALPVDFHPGVHGSLTDWLQRAQAQNPALAALRLSARAADARIGAAESGYLPTLSLALTHSRITQSGHSDYAVPGNSVVTPSAFQGSDNTIAVELSWNFFSGGATRAAVARASATADAAAANAATQRLDLERNVKTDYAALASDSDVIARLRDAVAYFKEAVSATAKGIPAGVRTEDDLVTQRERLLAAEQQFNGAIATSIGDEVALAQDAGELTPQRIKSLSDTLSGTQPANAATHSGASP